MVQNYRRRRQEPPEGKETIKEKCLEKIRDKKGDHMQQVLNTKLNTEDEESPACAESGMKTKKEFQSMVTQPTLAKSKE